MLVMKFGGASVKDAAGVRTVTDIVRLYHEKGERMVVVVSAMDKTTNALEQLAGFATHGKADETNQQLEKIRQFHLDAAQELLGIGTLDGEAVAHRLTQYLEEVQRKVQGVLMLGEFPARIYDRIMAYGELMSSVILHQYLVHKGLPAIWVDAREIITTDSNYKQAEVVWNLTQENVETQLKPLMEAHPIVVIQGYIASNTEGKTTTLGREGSDFTASILGNALDAREVIIWKDVPGVMSADPRVEPDFAKKIDSLSYETAVEMTFYGASVIHPKTIKPLQNKGIPLYVKCFKDVSLSGTVIQPGVEEETSHVPSRIQKKHQALITLRPRDFSFMDEHLLRQVFDLSSRTGIQINLVQTSAISARLVVDNAVEAVEAFVSSATDMFEVQVRVGLTLVSLLYHNGMQMPSAKPLLLQQDERHIHMVVAAG